MDLLSSELFQGIPGLALELKKKTYVRENMTPVFITERTPGENRENLWELLEQCDMDYLNRLEWLIRTDTKYSGDPLYVKRAEKPVTLEVGNLSDLGPGSKQILQKLLDAICKGGIIRAGQCKIDDTNRKDFYYILREIYAQEILTNILPK